MTVETQSNKITASGNGVATSFSFSPMVIFESTDLLVVKRDTDNVETTLSEGTGATNYSVSVSEYPGTGSITYPATGTANILATGETLIIKRKLTLEQTLDLENQGGYFPDNQETAFDKLTMMTLQQQEEIDRALKLPITDTGSAALPTLEGNASKMLSVKADESGFQFVSALDEATAVSAFMETVLDDATAAAARTTLGVLLPTEAGDGLVGTPGMAFASDPNTGIYRKGTDHMALVTGGVEVLEIRSDGALLKPLQPAFSVRNTANITNQTGNGAQPAVAFGSEVFDRGGDFASNSLTAPVTGIYQLNAMVTLSNFGAGATRAILRIVTSNRTYEHQVQGVPTSNLAHVISLSVTTDMDAADTAHVTIVVTGMAGDTVTVVGHASDMVTCFSGFLVG